ncbi:MAG: sulfatase-like hydrolase/transferase [Sedimentisphaerales bacterium]|nr:sulfatase-like hydrolase/transferase [Sedimentisphaerales bacterium]
MQSRRTFLKAAGICFGSFWLSGCDQGGINTQSVQKLPNILWLTCEDLSPWIGCYGDANATTPNIDALAKKGTRYTNAYASAPVCAPARSCLITGVYATSLGTQHLRSSIKIPEHIRCFTEHLRNAGYYCTNNVKKDYNFQDVNAWDESSTQAHWRNRPNGKPFFSVFNFMITHQSRLNGSDAEWEAKYGSQLEASKRHDPSVMKIPPYYPDTIEIRKMWARYYDLATLMDQQVGQFLDQLKEDGLEEDTIIFWYSDHGSGIPRHKRDLRDSGLKVPLVIHVPDKYKYMAPIAAGQAADQLVSFVDFAPTVLSLAGVKIPDYMQGSAFLGDQEGRPRQFVYAHASRVDEAYDMARCVRDKRYKYIRNFLPHLPWVQPSAYPDNAEILRELRRALDTDEMNKIQSAMFEPRAAEELYDTQDDPYEIINLIESSQHQATADRLRDQLHQWMLDIRDTGLLPEAEMHIRSQGSTPYETMRNERVVPIKRILDAAETVGKKNPSERFVFLENDNAAVRYWGIVSIGQQPKQEWINVIRERLSDSSPNVRFAAAGILTRWSGSKEALEVLVRGLDDPRGPVALAAARELEWLRAGAMPVVAQIRAARDANFESNRNNDYKMFIDWALTYVLRYCGIEAEYLMKF